MNHVDLCRGTSCDLCPLLSTVQSICNPTRGVLYGVRGAQGALCLHPRQIYTGQVSESVNQYVVFYGVAKWSFIKNNSGEMSY